MNQLHKKSTIAAFAMLSLGTALAGCTPTAPDANTDTGTDTGTATGTDTGTDTGTGTGTTGTYVDGAYTESGDYTAPSGAETVEVTVTLADGIITDVTVVGDATDPTAQNRQGQFIAGIAAIVEGKNIDELDVQKVGGSSLTSSGFNAAIDAIKADAAA